MANYPDIRQGTRFSDTSARQWQSAFQSLEGVAGMTVGPGLAVIRSGDAIEIRLDSELEGLLLPSITVVVTEKPAEGDKALTVRRVIYGPSVPMAGEYQWADETTLVVFPEVGAMPSDFADLVWAPTNEQDEPIDPLPPPTLEAHFLRARRRGEFWFVEIPGAGGTEHQQFKVDSVGFEFINCRTWDGIDLGVGTLEIWKPWLLRRSSSPEGELRGDIAYTWEHPQKRTAQRLLPGDPPITITEVQVIVPSYRTGDVMYASKRITGLVDTAWVDDNRDGRAWAKEVPTP